jgi:hypothetical protein
LENVIGKLANGSASSRLKRTVHMPERVVSDLTSEREHNQLWKFELQPKTSCVGESWPFIVTRDMRVEPAMFANLLNEMLLVFVQLRRICVESCTHGNHALSLSQEFQLTSVRLGIDLQATE